MPKLELKNFDVKFTLDSGEEGVFHATSPTSTLAAFDFCQWAYDCSMLVVSMNIVEDLSDGE